MEIDEHYDEEIEEKRQLLQLKPAETFSVLPDVNATLADKAQYRGLTCSSVTPAVHRWCCILVLAMLWYTATLLFLVSTLVQMLLKISSIPVKQCGAALNVAALQTLAAQKR